MSIGILVVSKGVGLAGINFADFTAPGIANFSTTVNVPEPASWALLGLGLGSVDDPARLKGGEKLMKIHALYLGGVLSLAFAANANATIIGSTYEFSTSTTGSTTIAATAGTYTDPANPGFCVGPPLACASGSGLSGSFAFSNVSPTLDRITFTFFGSTFFAPGSFTIRLGNFVTTDGETITGVSYNSGNLATGNFSSVSFNGTHASFTGTTSSSYSAIGGSRVVFDVTTTPAAVPEPASLSLLATGLVALGVRRRCRKRA